MSIRQWKTIVRGESFLLTYLKGFVAGTTLMRMYRSVKAYRGLTGGFLLLQTFSVAISVSPRVCFILVLNLISMFLR